MTTVNEVVVTGNDDGYMDEEYYYGSFDQFASVFDNSFARVRFGQASDMGDPAMHLRIRTGYFRFQTVNVPQGANISSAKLQLAFHSTTNGPGNTIDIYGNDVDDASAPTSVTDFRSKVKTTEKVTWTVPSSMVAGTFYDTPDIADVVQEVVNRTGWTANNDMMFIMPASSFNSNTNWLTQFRSYNYGTSYRPKLVITYTLGVTVTGIIAGLNTAAITGTVEYGSLSIVPTLAGADTAAIMGTSVLGSLSVTPTLAGADTSAIAGTVLLASFSVTPSAANAATAAIGPFFNEVTPANPANADTAAIMGTIEYGSLSTTATAANADTAAILGTVVFTSESVTPSAAVANVNAESVTVLLSSFSLTPSAANADTAAIPPYVLIILPTITNGLYIAGSADYSSKQVVALEGGTIIYKTGETLYNKTVDTAAVAATTYYRATTYFTAGNIEQKIILQDGGSIVVKSLP
jgi:hypothetical protein